MTERLQPTWLPAMWRTIADAAGLEAALKLAAARGGTRVFIPKHAGDDHWLVQLLGRAAADAVCRLYGGEPYTLPADPVSGLKGMRLRADKALDEGASADEAARRSGLHVRSIYLRKAARKQRAGSDQGSLF